MLLPSYYAQNYAGIIGSSLNLTNDPDFPDVGFSDNEGDDIERTSPSTPDQSSSNTPSESTLARNDMVST